MNTVSKLWESIAKGRNHRYRTKVVINGNIELDESSIYSLKTYHKTFDDPSLGNAIAGEIDLVIKRGNNTIPRMAKIEPYISVCNATQQSEWVKKGVYYIDTRSYDKDLDKLTIHGYDGMMFLDQNFPDGFEFTSCMVLKCIMDVATAAGLTYSNKFTLAYNFWKNGQSYIKENHIIYSFCFDEYQLQNVPYTMRNFLGYCGSVFGINFFMNDKGELDCVAFGIGIKTPLYHVKDGTKAAITIDGECIYV